MDSPFTAKRPYRWMSESDLMQRLSSDERKELQDIQSRCIGDVDTLMDATTDFFNFILKTKLTPDDINWDYGVNPNHVGEIPYYIPKQ